MSEIDDLMREVLNPHRLRAVLDDAGGDGYDNDHGKNAATVYDGAQDHATKTFEKNALYGLHEWVESDDLDEGETEADRLMAIMVGIADANQDGELDEGEQEVINTALNSAYDYLVDKGVAEDDASLLLNDWDTDAAVRVKERLAASLPDGQEASMDEIDGFVFGNDQEALMDAVYRKKIVFRGGQKIKVNRRIAGHVRLSSKQKMAVRKMQLRSHTASARLHRGKSMRQRQRAGL